MRLTYTQACAVFSGLTTDVGGPTWQSGIPSGVMIGSSINYARETGYTSIKRSSRRFSDLRQKPRKKKAVLTLFQVQEAQDQVLVLVPVTSSHPLFILSIGPSQRG